MVREAEVGCVGLGGKEGLDLIQEEPCLYLSKATRDILSCYAWPCTKDLGGIYKPHTKNHV